MAHCRTRPVFSHDGEPAAVGVKREAREGGSAMSIFEDLKNGQSYDISDPQYVKEAYRRFLENKIRENWTLTGSPINVFIRQK